MGDISQAFYDRLSGDVTLAALLTEYPAGSGNAAVFTSDPVPEDAVFPFIVTAGEISQTPADAKLAGGHDAAQTDPTEGLFPSLPDSTARLREVLRDIRCYTNETGGAAAIESIQERVRALFHRFQLTVANFNTVVASVDGITVADEQDVYGRIVTVRLTLEES